MNFKTVIASAGYVEDNQNARLVFTHLNGGFDTWEEMLRDLSECLHKALEKARKYDEFTPDSVEDWIINLNRTTCDSMKGHDAYEHLWSSGWQIYEALKEGTIEITEKAEHVLTDPDLLEKPDYIYEVSRMT